MSVLVPRLEREAAHQIISRKRDMSIAELSGALPDLSAVVTYSALGSPIAREDLVTLRRRVVDLAREHGFPGQPAGLAEFEGSCARVLRDAVQVTPHEASHEEVWSYLTCCWLLDVALWRFGGAADEKRFIGNVNRNTFRRLWWRAEILGPDIDLKRLGEDELANIMERPTIAGDRRLAKAIAREFLDRVDSREVGGRSEVGERMQLMREAMKRLLRLTPFVAFSALTHDDLASLVAETFDASQEPFGRRAAVAKYEAQAVPDPSPVVTRIPSLSISRSSDESEMPGTSDVGRDFEAVSQIALDVARRTGRVTNMTLREVVPLTSQEARDVLTGLVSRRALERRGAKRGTHYVIPHGSETGGSRTRPAESALRRLLRRAR